MIIPSYATIYFRGAKLKAGSECPKELEPVLQNAIDSTIARAKAQGERLSPYDGEERVLNSCSQYAEYNIAVGMAYREARRDKKNSPAKKKKD